MPLPTFGAVDLLLGDEAKHQTKYSHICCGRVNIVTMTVIVAVIQLIYNVVSVSGYIYALSTGAENYEDANPVFSSAIAYESMPAMLALQLLWLIFLITLFYGIKEAQALMLIPQGVVQAAGTFMAIYMFFGNLIALIRNKDEISGLSVGMIFMALALLCLQIFCLIVIVRCFRFLKAQKRRMTEPGTNPLMVQRPMSGPPAWATNGSSRPHTGNGEHQEEKSV